MRKYLATLVLAVAMGVLGFAVSGVAVAGVSDKPPAPPGQGECEHGNAAKPCKEDPQPDKGKDCELHGNNGGVNEDHCEGTTPPPPPAEETVDVCLKGVIVTLPSGAVGDDSCGGTTTTETTETETTVTVPTSGGSNASPPSIPSSEPSPTPEMESPVAPKIVGTPPVAAAAKDQARVLGGTADAPKPTRQAQQAPLTL